jgi:hypothetical protein
VPRCHMPRLPLLALASHPPSILDLASILALPLQMTLHMTVASPLALAKFPQVERREGEGKVKVFFIRVFSFMKEKSVCEGKFVCYLRRLFPSQMISDKFPSYVRTFANDFLKFPSKVLTFVNDC